MSVHPGWLVRAVIAVGALFATGTLFAPAAMADEASLDQPADPADPADPAEPAALAYACPPPLPENTFDDVHLDGVHTAAIECLFTWGITSGVDGTRYDPSGTVTRAQMATFLANLMARTDAPLPEGEPGRFVDVAGFHAANIDALAASGIASGVTEDRFEPNDPVSRAQMATFLWQLLAARDLDLTAVPDGHGFEDVAGVHAGAIGALAAAGIAAGVTEDRFEPARPVSRAQMASFLLRTVDVLIGEGDAFPPFVPPDTDPALLGFRRTVSLEPGTATTVEVRLTATELDAEARVELGPGLTDNVSWAELAAAPGDSGTHHVRLRVHAAADAAPGTRAAGQVRVVDAAGQLRERGYLRLDIVEPDPDTLGTALRDPSPDRLAPLGDGWYVTDQVTVTLTSSLTPSLTALTPSLTSSLTSSGDDPLARAHAVASRHDAEVAGGDSAARLFQLRLPAATDTGALIAAIESLADDPDVARAAPRLLDGEVDRVPNDPAWDPWTPDAPSGNNWHLDAIGATEAWRMATDASEVTVAVFDVDFPAAIGELSHPDLTGRVRLGRPGPAGVGDYHGSLVAGVACADGDNGVGITGVAWDCDLRGYEVFTLCEDGEVCVDSDRERLAMQLAADAGARVVNMSYGTRRCTPFEGDVDQAVLMALARADRIEAIRAASALSDALWVTSAGNAACDAAHAEPSNLVPDLPDLLLAVAATNREGGLWRKNDEEASNFGEVVDIAAPGDDVLTTAGGDDLYVAASGTSLAAPIVSGAAALAFAIDPELTAAEVRECIVTSSAAGRQIAGHDFDELHLPSVLECAGAEQPPGSFRATEVAAGARHTCALDTDGGVWCWGENGRGQLGSGASGAGPAANRSAPVPVHLDVEVAAITAGGAHTCAITIDDEVWCWGANDQGQLGDGSTIDRDTPTPVTQLGRVLEVIAGGGHTCARDMDQQLWCWGSNSVGQLGLAAATALRSAPVAVEGIPALSSASASGGHSCGVDRDGGVWCWGDNRAGQTGSEVLETHQPPTRVAQIDDADTVGTGWGTTCTNDAEGGLCCVALAGLGLDYGYSCAQRGDGSVACWGVNVYGPEQFALPDQWWLPRTIRGVEGVLDLGVGGGHNCVRDADGVLQCWGRNHHGQLGDASLDERPFPVELPSPDRVRQMDLGADHTCLVDEDGAVWCWGRNTSGQLGDRTLDYRITPVRVARSGS